MTRFMVQGPQDFKQFQSNLGRIFEPFVRYAAAASEDEDLVSGNWAPAVDVAETKEKILVRAEVPGMKQDAIAIEFENGLLTIRGERKHEKAEGMTWHRVERTYGTFSR